MIIVAASGMATGGRVVHHLRAFAPDPRNTILFSGFQAGGTRGAAILAGAESVKIHGAYVPVRAEVGLIDNLSAHADCDEILAWLKRFERPPRETFVTHGEPAAADALRHRIEEELGRPPARPRPTGIFSGCATWGSTPTSTTSSSCAATATSAGRRDSPRSRAWK
jgi:metallo-beta-lactamase family protein